MSKFPYPYQCFTVREHFDSYIEKRIPVVPILGETPCVPWQQYQKKVPTENEVREWFKKFSPTGLAVLTGRFSNILVFEIEKGEDVSSLGIPTNGPICEAGNGNIQYWFTYPRNMDIPTISLEGFAGVKGVLRAENSYVIAPSSKHLSGAVYEWATDNKYIYLRQLPKAFLKKLNNYIQSKN